MATMQRKAICALLVVFSLALGTLAQGQAGKTASSRFLVGTWAQRGGLDGVSVSQCVF